MMVLIPQYGDSFATNTIVQLCINSWTYNPEDEGNTFLQNERMKLPNYHARTQKT
jgi:hypothetical protein